MILMWAAYKRERHPERGRRQPETEKYYFRVCWLWKRTAAGEAYRQPELECGYQQCSLDLRKKKMKNYFWGKNFFIFYFCISLVDWCIGIRSLQTNSLF